MDFHVAIDSGRFGEKTAMKCGYRDWIPTVLGKGFEMNLDRKFRDTDISLKTSYGWFFIGDLAIDECADGARMMTLSKIHEDTKTFIISSVARAIQKKAIPNGSSVRITTGVPIKDFNKETKKELEKLICGMYTVEMNGDAFFFFINEINLSVEGVAAHKILCNKNKGVYRYIDIGSRTVNYGTVKNGLYVNRESGTLEYGYSQEKSHKDFTRKVIADISATWDNFKDETYLFGGGARYCAFDFNNYCPNLLCATQPEWVNVLAFLENGEKTA